MLRTIQPKPKGVIPSGSLSLDVALGGGYPRGRVIEIFGPEASAKTTLALHAMAGSGGECGYLDLEGSLDVDYASRIVPQGFAYCSDLVAEEALGLAEEWVSSGASVVVIDSLAAILPTMEADGRLGEAHMGLHARLIAQFLRRVIPKLGECLLVLINQVRYKLGVSFGSPETTTGGMSVRYFSSVRLDARPTDDLKEDQTIGKWVQVKVRKHKLHPPGGVARVPIRWGVGIDAGLDALEVGLALGIVEQRGSTYWLGDNKLGIGKVASARSLDISVIRRACGY